MLRKHARPFVACIRLFGDNGSRPMVRRYVHGKSLRCDRSVASNISPFAFARPQVQHDRCRIHDPKPLMALGQRLKRVASNYACLFEVR